MFMTDAEEKKADEEYAEEQRVRQAAIEKNKQQQLQQQQSQSASSEPLVLSSTASKSDSKQLMVTGMYRIVRHPMYMWLQLTVLLTPHMPFDRMVYFAATTALLYVGLKFEERKLLREFGEDYAAYMKRTPMLFPSITALCGCGSRNKTNNKKTQ
jgi:steroid 5-alpha reductase family enzyme